MKRLTPLRVASKAWPWATPLMWAGCLSLLALAPGLMDSRWGLSLLSQMGIAVIACLSFNLLLGQGGMLSFGHAVYTGAGTYAAIHLLRWTAQGSLVVPVPLVPLFAGCASALLAVLLGGISTRRPGTALAMITLGLGELVYAAAQMFPAVFGGEGGLSANRAPGAAQPMGINFGSQAQLYGLIAAYALLCTAVLSSFAKSPLGLSLQAARDNHERARFVGMDDWRVRFRVFVVAAFFAGVSGGLAALHFEIATPEVFNSHRSAAYLLFTYLGGAGYFHGAMLGGVIMVLTQVLLSEYTPAWMLYLGLLFIVMVLVAPEGLASLPGRIRTIGRRRPTPWLAASVVVALAGVSLASVVALVEMAYFAQLGSALGPVLRLWGLALDTTRGATWLMSAAMAMAAGLAAWRVALHSFETNTASEFPEEIPTGPQTDLAQTALAPAPGVVSHGEISLRTESSESDGAGPSRVLRGVPRPIALQILGVSKSYGQTNILQNVSLTLAEGECLALIGPNGAGKSTLFNVISGRQQPSEGAVVLGGRRIDQATPQAIQGLGLARSFQTSNLFLNLTVADSLRCAVLGARGLSDRLRLSGRQTKAVRERVHALLQQLDLQSRAHLVARNLSYADQRALELGLALAGDPSVLLLDEPTAGMSPAETDKSIALIRRAARGKSLLIVEHDMSVVFGLADKIAVLAQGELIACDSPAAVRSNPIVQAAYLGHDADNIAHPDRTASVQNGATAHA